MIDKPGDLVKVFNDRRPGRAAIGQTAVYEGELPHTVYLITPHGPELWGIDDFVAGKAIARNDKGGSPAVVASPQLVDDVSEAITGNFIFKDDQKPNYYWVIYSNPRLRLQDGSTIWGRECWWQNVSGVDETAVSVEIESLEDYMQSLRERVAVIAKEFGDE